MVPTALSCCQGMRKEQHYPSCSKLAQALHPSQAFCTRFTKAKFLFPNRVHLFPHPNLCLHLTSMVSILGKYSGLSLSFLILLKPHIASLLFLEHTKPYPSLRPWYWLFPRTGMSFTRCLHGQLHHILCFAHASSQ